MQENNSGKISEFGKTFLDAFLIRNIVLVQAIGICPIIAVGTHLKFGVVMTICTGLVLLPSAILMSFVGDKMPSWLRAPVYTFGAALLLAGGAYIIDIFISHDIYGSLDVFIPLIAVNTLISYRAGGFAINNKTSLAMIDAVASTLGFGVVICLLSALREIVSFGTLWGHSLNLKYVLPEAALPYAAFIILGFMAALLQWGKTAAARSASEKAKQTENMQQVVEAGVDSD